MATHAKERKILFMGFRSVGKSSLIIQFVENQFVDNYEPTIENTFQKQFKLGGQDFNLQVVDTAGQDEYSIMPQSYFMNINGYVIVYSVNSEKSFKVAQTVYDKLRDMKGELGVPVVLVGNKKDLRMEREIPKQSVFTRLWGDSVDTEAETEEHCQLNESVISFEEGKKLAESWKAPFLEASAKENSSVTEIFEKVIQVITTQENGGVQNKSSCSLS